jgi:hypothetical protein
LRSHGLSLARTQAGADVQLYFLDAPDDVILQRLARRNAARPPKTFFVSEETFRMWRPFLEPPHADERAIRVAENVPVDNADGDAGSRLLLPPLRNLCDAAIAVCAATAAPGLPQHLSHLEQWLPSR